MGNSIVIKGAREHNLKNIDVEIPRDKLVVITGLSGSGKSSPDVDSIEGLSPAISIEQKSTSHNPRSTVGTVTEIYDYLRLLFARVGRPYCFQCGDEITAQTVQQMVDAIASVPEGMKFQILAPIVRGRKGEYRKELLEMRKAGYVRARVDGKIVDLGEDVTLDKQKKHTIEVIIDRLVMKSGEALMRRLADSVETATKLTGGLVAVLPENGNTRLYSDKLACINCGVSYPEITPRVFSFNSPHGACPACDGIGYAMTPGGQEQEDFTLLEPCTVCHGARLRPESLSIKLAKQSIAEVTSLSVRVAADFFLSLKFTDRELVIAHRILKEIRERLGFLVNVGLDYLTLDRAAATLSGGEGQRIRLATQIGSGLVGVLYILDEPSIGLHQRDNRRLLQTLLRLRDLGNTVVVVEHDAETMMAADHLLDMGPGAGSQGGHVIAQGTPQQIMGDPNSLTGQYLRGIQTVSVPQRHRKPRGTLSVVGAQKHNLKNVTARIPMGLFTCVTGVSGSGKSTLVLEVLFHSLSQLLYHKKPKIDGCKDLRGVDGLDKVIDIDQSPIGMHFLPDVYVTCEVCKGQRYNRETMEILHKGKSIADVLNMTVDDALEFFEHIPLIKTKLQTLHDVGLHYVKLGQSATTLSGGEAQRVKLSRELSKRATGRTMYILDEPTTGLHFADVQRLLDVLDRLVEAGNTVLVIEHNLDVIKNADWIIDLGPEGGDRGGEIVAEGPPKEIAKAKRSYTGQVLREAGV
ncbi:MAG: ATP-binding cassette domain-containing protein [Nitrospirae bacterium]|nr:ATP-binding cassette domain-containing protein [Nitrospirota bacterium]